MNADKMMRFVAICVVAAEDERRRAFTIKDDGLYVYSGLVLFVK